MNPSRRRFLQRGLLGGAVAVAGCAGQADSDTDPNDTDGPAESANGGGSGETDRPSDATGSEGPVGYSVVTGWFDPDPPSETGWVHIAERGQGTDVTFDLRLCTGEEVAVSLMDPMPGRYMLDFTPVDESVTDSLGEGDCSAGTHVRGTGRLRADWNEFVVTVGGNELRAFEPVESVELHLLADPISV